MRIVIIMIVFLSLLVINVNAPGDDAVQPGFADMSLCTANGGYCLYDHEVNARGCINRIRGENGERLCEGFYENDNREGVEGVNCCGIEEEDNGDANIDEGVTLLSVRNIGTVRIGVNGEEPCCVQEGYVPDDNEVCCISGERRPLDDDNVGSGRCGCPNIPGGSRLVWDPEYPNDNGPSGACRAPRQTCYDPVAEEEAGVCNKNFRTNFVDWLLDPNCFMDFGENVGGNAPYERACCPYIPGEGYDEIWDFQIDDSLVQVY